MNHRFSLTLLAAATALCTPAVAQEATKKPVKVGYTNTPQIPGQKWKVHDADRPRPKVVTPGVASTPSAVGKPPSDAIVLFDGKNLDQWSGRGGKPAQWVVKDGFMEVKPRTGASRSKQGFGDCQLHIEWQSPAAVKGKSQGRGNSGVFLMSRYEIQVLDSYQNPSYADGQAGALYGQMPPLVNACRKPGTWQSYDIIFKAPRFKEGKLVTPATVTVIHNGVLLHFNQTIMGATTHKKVAKYKAHPAKAPIQLQDHGNPTRFRNIWVRPLELAKPRQ